MSYLLIVHHSPTDKLRGIAAHVLAAARDAAEEVNTELPEALRLEVRERNALEPDVAELRDAAAVILGTTANFGYISGALKHYFDSTFMQLQPPAEGTLSADGGSGTPTGYDGVLGAAKLFSYWIRGGYDTTGAVKAMTAITGGYGWTLAAEPVVFTGEVEPHHDELQAMAENVVGAWFATVTE
ncbi:MAG: flavodoxin family protein [Corynebacterium nuruki]|jgi:multimeric flavodoxin WrbA|nr:flavodoxin family protein [Corynebacterium nuruki]